LKIVLVVVLVLVPDKKPSDYDDENEDEYDPAGSHTKDRLGRHAPIFIGDGELE
jgi:hypothetical protein